MAIVVNYIRDYAAWVYGACALIALRYLVAAIRARRDRRFAVFSLEREEALNRTYGAWTAAIALAVVIGVVFLLSTVVWDAVQPLVAAVSTPTATPALAGGRPTATPTLPLSEIVSETPTATPLPRPTRRPEPTIIVVTTPSSQAAQQAPACPDARASITSPGLNTPVSGITPIIGTAAHERFQYYKLEYGAGTNPAVWSYFDGGDKVVRGGRLGALNAGALAPGVYSLRIVVVDASGNFPPPCVTVVVIR